MVDDTELERLYDYPPDLDRAWVQTNFVSSVDGAVAVDGLSAGLSSPADKKVFSLGRDLADVVLVGWGTASAEGYRGVKRTEVRRERRARLGLSPLPPIAVVTARGSVAPDAPIVTDTTVPPIVVTTASAPADRRAALASAGADVIVAGAETVDLRFALAALAERGLRRVTCEGGPRLLGALVEADLVDQMCLTVSPVLAGGGAGRIATGAPTSVPVGLDLASVLTDNGFLMLRYRRACRP
ncbi:pyrimidine reductase family protein [Actinokineospora auranticolor]|uniref:Riboflavin biosynthesis pyrimidine reductase n=1 Tax=Actinokineospora auranticolor TaxID=155976 RepID=A0A2S6GHJ0_9PSEU|nr:pyrimidine reductase family protein [Actinokineospora auranticolor]PPK64698.1 riboflavin biosynthesis pyrimidine reductase [Actinokineospora auranticolor]